MKELMESILKFRDERDWKQFHTPENLAKSISIEAAELLENFQWSNDFSEDKVKDELADILIYCFLMADTLKLDVIDIMHKKIEKNSNKYPISKSKGNSKKYSEFNK